VSARQGDCDAVRATGKAKLTRPRVRRTAAGRACAEHVFCVVRRLWGFSKVRYRCLAKNATRAFTALELANICVGRGRLLAQVRP
jgi:IS5 family transposase